MAALTAVAPSTLMLKAAQARTTAGTVAMESTAEAVLIATALKRLLVLALRLVALVLMLASLEARTAPMAVTEREAQRAPP